MLAVHEGLVAFDKLVDGTMWATVKVASPVLAHGFNVRGDGQWFVFALIYHPGDGRGIPQVGSQFFVGVT